MRPVIRLLCLPLLLSATLAGATEPLLLQAAQIKALGIETIELGSAQTGRGGSFPGRVVVPTDQMRVVAAPVSGLLEMISVAPGVSVRRGQVLAHLASPQALELQRDALQSATQAALLQQNLKRDELLFAEGLIAESRLQATRASAAQATAQATAGRQGLGMAGLKAGKLGGPLALVSPIDGVVLEQAVQLGLRVDASTVIFRIARLSPLWLEVQVPRELAASLRPGAAVKVLDSEVVGKVIAINPAVDAASQTNLLRAVVGAGAEQLSPGQLLEVEIASSANTPQRLPASALIRNQGKVLAFVQIAGSGPESRFEARPVRIVSQGGDSVAVDGVKAGEKIVVRGVSGLKAMLTGVGQE
jgi:RND family efflux transporter MFP subunit